MITPRKRPIFQRSTFSLIVFFLGWAFLHGVQQTENTRVKKSCTSNLYILKVSQTGVGPVYSCISRVQAYGPGLPLKD
jgi:hypothetical protein